MTPIAKTSRLTRRSFIHVAGSACALSSLPLPGILFAKDRELVISRILIQVAKGRRLSPVAPNAYTAYRGYETEEPVLRIQTSQGLEGICQGGGNPKVLQQLIGLDPFKLFRFDANDHIIGPAEQYESLLAKVGRYDVALLDLIGKALKRPVAAILGKNVRESVQAYDGSVYLEDLLEPQQRQDLVFIEGSIPRDPVQIAVHKARWVTNDRAEGFKALKIKIGRFRWMPSQEAALARDIEVTNAVRAAVGPDIKLMVDANRSYWGREHMALSYGDGVAGSNVYFMEELFPETDTSSLHELKRRLRVSRNPVKLAAGEFYPGGVSEEVYKRRLEVWGIDEPLLDIEQADMNAHGFLYLRSKAAIQAKLGMTMAPHNFGSKLGFYSQVHLGMVTPNWDISEVDDAAYPAFVAEGIELKGGFARLTGAPGLGVTLREKYLERPTLEV
jgi:D-galactarolactone cycloisomerase